MNGMMNHCGAVTITDENASVDDALAALAGLPNPKPLNKDGSVWRNFELDGPQTHYPVRHLETVAPLFDSLQSGGYKIAGTQFAYHADKGNTFGLIHLEAEADESWSRMIATRGSYTKLFSEGIAAGTRVFVCDNLCFSSDMVAVGRKHTKNILRDLHRLIGKVTGLLSDHWEDEQKRIDLLTDRALTQTEVHDIVCKGLKAGAMPASKIDPVLTEWADYGRGETPDGIATPEEFKPRTGWSLLNAFTEVAKCWPQPTLIDRSRRMVGVLDTHCGFTPASELARMEVVEMDDADITIRS